MAQGEGGHPPEVPDRDLARALERRRRPRRADERQLSAQAVGAERQAQGGRVVQRGVLHRDPLQRAAAPDNPAAHPVIGLRPLRHEATGVAVIRITPPQHLDPLRRGRGGMHLDRQPEPVQQLGAQVSLLGIATPHQDKSGRMPQAQPLPLHQVDPAGRHVEQQVHEVVLQQVHLVDIEKPAMRPGQDPRLEVLLPPGERPLQVERANHPVLRGAEREVHHRHRGAPGLELLPLGFTRMTFIATGAVSSGVAAVAAAGDDRHRREHPRHRAHRGGLAGAAVAEHHDPADGGIHRGDEQGQLHLFLAHDGGEREGL